GNPIELNLLSGRVEVSNLNLVAKTTGTINLRDGIFHAHSLTAAAGTVNLLNGGMGALTIDVLDAALDNNFYLNFENGTQADFTFGKNVDGSPVDWEWLIGNGQVSIDGIAVSKLSRYLITHDGVAATIALNYGPDAQGALSHPFLAEVTSTGGQDSVTFQWQGEGGIGYMLEQCPDVFFSSGVQPRYFLGDGGVVSTGNPLPPEQDSGFWRVFSLSTSNGVCVAQSGTYSNQLVRYDDAGNPAPLHAFGVNYYDAFLRYINDVNDTSFVEGFEYLRDHHIPVARVLAAGFWPKQWNLYFTDKAEYFRRLDYFVSQAERCGVGLIIDCFWATVTVGEIVDDAVAAGLLVPGVDFVPPNPLNVDLYGDPTHAEYKRALGRADSGSNAIIAYYTRELVERYGRSPAIWGWEFGNEYSNVVDHPNILAMRDRPGSPAAQGMMLPNSSTNLVELPAWTGPDDLIRADVEVAKINFSQTVRSIDTWRLIMGGDSNPRSSAYHNWTEHSWTKDSRAELAQVIPVDQPSPMDTVTVHVYPGSPTASPEIYFTDDPVTNQWLTGQYKAFLDYFVAESTALGRPLIVGEWGAKGDGTTADEKTTFHRFLQALIDSEVQLSLLWDFDNKNAGQVGQWYVNPGTAKEYQLSNTDTNLWDLEQANLFFEN
ncbi:MAG: cellulase family glycosylhydrolase, partial [Verrucomicrobiota bacterium]|nr:cellulase family glycosylhydrolase [Verrucomicrobiota bacterium]